MNPVQNFQHIDLSYLKRITDKQKDIINNYIETFFKEVSEQIELLNRQQATGDWNGFRDTIHSLKALMNFMGAFKSEEILKEFKDHILTQPESGKLNDLKQKLQHEYEQVYKELQSVLKDNAKQFYD